MSGKNEPRVIRILDAIGYELGKDYFRQYPIAEKFVIDVAFIDERIALEIDGKSHNLSKQKRKDSKRDKFLSDNGWLVIRIKEDKFFEDTFTRIFYKNVIKEIVKERRKQLQSGFLYPVDIPEFIDTDYE